MISDMIWENACRLDEILAELNREAMRHRAVRDDYQL